MLGLDVEAQLFNDRSDMESSTPFNDDKFEEDKTLFDVVVTGTVTADDVVVAAAAADMIEGIC